MEELVNLLEKFAENFESNIPFFSYELFEYIKYLCESTIVKTQKKNQFTNNKGQSLVRKEEYRRRLHYSASYILAIIQKEENAAMQEDEEILEIVKALDAKPYQFNV